MVVRGGGGHFVWSLDLLNAELPWKKYREGPRSQKVG